MGLLPPLLPRENRLLICRLQTWRLDRVNYWNNIRVLNYAPGLASPDLSPSAVANRTMKSASEAAKQTTQLPRHGPKTTRLKASPTTHNPPTAVGKQTTSNLDPKKWQCISLLWGCSPMLWTFGSVQNEYVSNWFLNVLVYLMTTIGSRLINSFKEVVGH